MTASTLPVVVLLLAAFSFWQGSRRALALSNRPESGKLHSRPEYYGMLTALWCALPAMIIFAFWQFFSESLLVGMAGKELTVNHTPGQVNLLMNDLKNLVSGNIISGEISEELQRAADRYNAMKQSASAALLIVVLCVALIPAFLIYRRIRPAMRARNHVEHIIEAFLILCSTLAVFTTLGIVLSVVFESFRFFQKVPLVDFLFGLQWSPQMALRPDQAGSSGSFGAVPVLAGTFMISGIALSVAVPIGLMAAIYLSEYAGVKFRAIMKPLLEILAGVPTVVYGFFAALVVAPMVRGVGSSCGLDVSSESALAAGLVMGIMIIPFVSSLSDDVINAVPQSLRDGSYGLGATKSETIKQVILPAALPGIVGSILLAASRAIGETMIVVMAAGLSANLSVNPLQAVTTVTVQIVTLLVGDQEFDSPKTLAAFALGLLLFVVTLMLNVIALYVVRKYREEYE